MAKLLYRGWTFPEGTLAKDADAFIDEQEGKKSSSGPGLGYDIKDIASKVSEKVSPYLDPQHWIDKAADVVAPLVQPSWMKDQVPYAPGHEMAEIIKDETRKPILPDWDKPIGSDTFPDLSQKIPLTPHQLFNVTMPMVPLAEKVAEGFSPKLSTLIEETPKAAYGTLQGFSTPANLALVGSGAAAPKAIGRLIGAKFAPDMLAGGFNKGVEGYTQSEYGDWAHGIPKMLQGAGDAALGLVGLTHAAKGMSPKEILEGAKEGAAFEDAEAILATDGVGNVINLPAAAKPTGMEMVPFQEQKIYSAPPINLPPPDPGFVARMKEKLSPMPDEGLPPMIEPVETPYRKISDVDQILRRAPFKREYQAHPEEISNLPDLENLPEPRILYHGGGFGAFDPKSFIRGTPEHSNMVQRIVEKARSEGIGAKEALERIKEEDKNLSDSFKSNQPKSFSNLRAYYDTAKREMMHSVGTALSKYGEPGNKIVAAENSRLNDSMELSGKWLGKLSKEFDKLKPTDAEWQQVVDALQNQSKSPPSKRLAPLINAIREIFKESGQLKDAVGMKRKVRDWDAEAKSYKIRDLPWASVENYFPQYTHESFWKELESKEGMKKYAEDLVGSGAEKDMAAATNRLKALLKNNRRTKSKVSGFQFSRMKDIDVPYDRTPAAVVRSILESSDQIARYKNFGADNSSLETLFLEAMENGADPSFMKGVMDKMVETRAPQGGWESLNRAARDFQTVTKLGPLTSMMNYFQRYNAIPRAGGSGLGSYVKGRMMSFKPEGIQFALDSGIIHPEFKLKGDRWEPKFDFASLASKLSDESPGVVQKYLDWIGMGKTEFNNRVISANTAKVYLDWLAKQARKNPNNKMVQRNLKDFGIDAKDLAERDPTTEEYHNAARKFVSDIQFHNSVLDLPYRWQTTGGKTITQFKPAAYKTTRFFKNYVLREAKNGNFRPLVNTIIISQIAGEATTDARDLLKLLTGGESKRSDGPWRLVENLAASPGIGMAADLLTMFDEGKGRFLSNYVTGPTVSDMIKGGQAGLKLGGEGDPVPLMKFGTEHIPVVGRDISKHLFSQ